MEKRKNIRVNQPYVIRFREIQPKVDANWDVASALNISKSGVCFNSSQKFPSGTKLELRMSNPVLHEDVVYHCSVLRSEESIGGKFYKIVVTLDELEDQFREAISQAIDMFIEKQDRTH